MARRKGARKSTRAQRLHESSREVLGRIVGFGRSEATVESDYARDLAEAENAADLLGVRLTGADRKHLRHGSERGQWLNRAEVRQNLEARADGREEFNYPPSG